MSSSVLILISSLYLLLLFYFAYYFRKNFRFSNSKYAYALSICVYCTAWTFYGSIGRFADSGFGYLSVYLGPTIVAPLMFIWLTKTIKISKYLRTSSIADFISARYGKDTSIGTIITLLCIFVAIPYISIQLKALNLSFNLVLNSSSFLHNSDSLLYDPALYFGITCALLSSIFGTVNAAPTDRHPGVVTVIAMESIFKLIAFIIGAFFIIYYINNGIPDIFNNFYSSGLNEEFLSIEKLKENSSQWFWLSLISAFAFILLPRQFHMAVVENKEVEHVKFASWFVPLYLFIISILVAPIAFSGMLNIGDAGVADNYLIMLLMDENLHIIALIVFVGGIAACTGMIITSLISLSIMFSNQILLPIQVKFNKLFTLKTTSLERQLIHFRRLSIFIILFLSYLFYAFYSINYSLVSIGLISFVGISQLVPSFVLGLYWKFANSKGAKAGLITGIIIWAYTLPVVNLCELGILPISLIEDGLFGIQILKPQALLGIKNLDPISLSSFLSLTANFTVTCLVSIYTERSPLEISQSDLFLYPEKYFNKNKLFTINSNANFSQLKNVLDEILGKKKVGILLETYLTDNNLKKFEEDADPAFVQYIENQLNGSLGSASTRLILENIIQHNPVKPEQLYNVLDQTNQLYEYSKELETNQKELKIKSDQLFEANNKLLELDQLKNEFISNITHELRTPLTSIQSLADSMERYDLEPNEREKVISIIKKESQRISTMVSQVLDLRKLETFDEIELEKFSINELINEVIATVKNRIKGRTINIKGENTYIYSDSNKIKQVILNLLINAIKFTSPENGIISINIYKTKKVFITIHDNGQGIPAQDLNYIFDRFFQASNINKSSQEGSGLGLSICKSLLTMLNGDISIKSKIRKGTKVTIEIENFSEQ